MSKKIEKIAQRTGVANSLRGVLRDLEQPRNYLVSIVNVLKRVLRSATSTFSVKNARFCRVKCVNQLQKKPNFLKCKISRVPQNPVFDDLVKVVGVLITLCSCK